ncbi:hypothetical protein D0869_01155 [Hortaea werneckii]|uniref:Gfd2/YDR514C-like C-terminal domain-containing protein n=2 Tax=Hortaea werneckii TaxID=91943 RepID=A0A3M7A851_HORWE|nr:hypothetical protein KC334_g8930 [Hortaea werneckii]KAI7005267.1 hypothetical protein KC355_g8292 [Hortaea werneckii]KAI7181690.1 hypothetical protein KC324_g8540 [Hortaea werneckii]KAI7582221.1 hypothetical protein KC316_g7998 [Hortaea werneckii]KAI7653626.1 hypothetical protein KC318_g14113 [Hortaea werneckii]
MGKNPGQKPASARDLEAVQQMLGLQPNTTSPKGSLTPIKDPIFVCIDCEAFEHNQSKITEIGVAVLDTRETSHLNNSSPLPAWFEKIKYAHYRPVEYARLRNKTFIQGCPEQFNFGPSTWVKLADMRRILCNIFADPTQLDRAADFSIPTTNTTSSPDQPQTDCRNIIFVAHGAGNDTTYLRHLSFDLSQQAQSTAAGSRIAQTLDTQKLSGSTKKSPLSLHRLCLCLHLEPKNLHNAGNDAGYTLQALIALAVNEHQNPGDFAREVREGEFAVGRKLPGMRFERGWKAPVVWAGSTREGNASSSSVEWGVGGATAPLGGVDRDGDEGGGGEGSVKTTMTTTKPERSQSLAQRQEREQERAKNGASPEPAPIVAENKAGGTKKRKRKREGLGDGADDG